MCDEYREPSMEHVANVSVRSLWGYYARLVETGMGFSHIENLVLQERKGNTDPCHHVLQLLSKPKATSGVTSADF